MKTSDVVTNERGGALLPADFVLTEAIIVALLKQGIQRIDVVEDSDGDKSDVSATQKAKHIEELFREFTSPNMTELKECLINQLQN
jgi:hypothetical protein